MGSGMVECPKCSYEMTIVNYCGSGDWYRVCEKCFYYEEVKKK